IVDLERGDRGRQLDLSGLDGRRRRPLVGDGDQGERAQIGTALLEVVGVALVLDGVATPGRLDLERPAADDVLPQVDVDASLYHVLGHDLHVVDGEQGKKGGGRKVQLRL